MGCQCCLAVLSALHAAFLVLQAYLRATMCSSQPWLLRVYGNRSRVTRHCMCLPSAAMRCVSQCRQILGLLQR